MVNITRKGEWCEIIIPRQWAGRTIEELFKVIWEAPKKLTHLFRMNQKILINGKSPDWNSPIEFGSKLQIKLFEEEEILIPPSYQEVPILYEDDHCIVFNKPPYMSTHPNNPALDRDTLVNAAAYHMQLNGELRNVRQIHRLDRDTSGAILFAKHPLSGVILDRMLENREIKRTYIALVHGLIKTKKGVINAPIGRDRHHATRRRVSPTGQEARTNYEVLKLDKDKNLSYIKCSLDTGRTHQIRVHFSHIGHPLAGDVLYGGKPIAGRQALHSAKIQFLHPFTQEMIVCFAPFIDQPPIFKHIDIYTI
jgi:23S rRNA pseudouridine1911/1915/1917 synthase